MDVRTFPVVAEVMTRQVFAVGPDTSVETAARLFAQKRVSGAPVVDEGGEVVGVVSSSDLVDPDRYTGAELGSSHYYALDSGYADEFGDPTVFRVGAVREVMTPTVLAIGPDESIVAAGRTMLSKGVHRLLVVDDDQLLAGIVSVTDLVRGFVSAPGID